MAMATRVCLMLSLLLMFLLQLDLATSFSWHHDHLKRDDVDDVVVREQGDTAPAGVEELRSEVSVLSQQLHQTRQELEQTKQQFQQQLQQLPRMEVKCRTRFTYWYEAVGKSLEYLDQFDIHCHSGEFLRQWRMTWGQHGIKKAVRFVCCKFNFSQPASHIVRHDTNTQSQHNQKGEGASSSGLQTPATDMR